jgi:hypothetical protein
LECKNCGDPLDPRRVELGYDYCLKEECQERYVKRVELAALGVNKAADYYVRADEVLPPRPLAPWPATPAADPESDLADEQPVPTTRPGPAPEQTRRPVSALERLRQQEAELDRALARSYERFRDGEITAREMDGECDGLVEAFNRQVRSENIRYRSMLRPRPHRGR